MKTYKHYREPLNVVGSITVNHYREPLNVVGSITVQTIQGDTWDSIAKKTLGSEYAMTVLMEANPEKIKTRIFDGGEKLNLPEVSTVFPTKITPPWGGK